ncbi:pantoate--beta-alanine ligase [Sodalis sp. CWE]|uniref:pantoate--beta-alanine ligase n=1 Tax=Sodalis sp. CWE TaxID=2803816 RepID=UPI001C7D9563|nr:pantoate--beta-alanine ligase [Sodalis sp. CWE]
MLIIESPKLLRHTVKQWHQKCNRIALIPTMGNLHDGHMALIDAGKTYADKVLVSIFINPMQFDQFEDLLKYPRTPRKDYEKLIKKGVDVVFAPKIESIYPNGLDNQTSVHVPSYITNILEGESRPNHFCGVSTIISKLFNLIQPNMAFFGEKDFQQLLVIRQLVKDMNYDVEIIGIPTVRDSDGLAFSSRNSLLNASERHLAIKLNQVLTQLVNQFFEKRNHIDKFDELLESAKKELVNFGIKPNRLVVRDAKTLKPLTTSSQKAIILFTVYIGNIRLIDNAQIDLI